MFSRQMVGVGLVAIMMLWLGGCGSVSHDFAKSTQQAHGVKAWKSHKAFEADIEVVYRGKTMLEGRILVDTRSEKARLTTFAGPELIWDGEYAWVTPADAPVTDARKHIRTWPYVITMPFRLGDRKVMIEPQNQMPIWDDQFDTAKVTYKNDADKPAWSIVYRQVGTNLIRSVAYDKAGDDPQALIFNRFIVMDGVKISTEWAMFMWSEQSGITGTPLGKVVLRNLRWAHPTKESFMAPEGARLVDAPQNMAAAK